MAISDIVAVNITVQDAAPSVADFGTPCVFAYHTNYVGARRYDASPSGLSAMITDGFATGDRAYEIVSAIAAQSPGTDKVYVYARGAGNAQTFDLTPTNTTEGYVYEFTVSVQGTETDISYTVPAAATVASVVTGIHALVNAVAGITATDDTTHVTVTPTTANTFVLLKGTPRHLDVKDLSTDAGIATDLAAALVDLGESFYGVLLDSFSKAESNAAASWAESNNKIFGAQSADTDILDSGSSTDLASDISGSGYHNTYVFFSRDMTGDGAAALMGRQFSRTPGLSTWAYQTLAGVAADNLTATELSGARDKNAITYVDTKGLKHTFDGFAGSGRYLDITRGVAWLKARIEEAIITVFVNAEKVPYTNEGISLLEAEVRGRLADAERKGFIASGWTVTPTPLDEVSTVDKASRLYDGIKFAATTAGAIHKVTIDGTIKV